MTPSEERTLKRDVINLLALCDDLLQAVKSLGNRVTELEEKEG